MEMHSAARRLLPVLSLLLVAWFAPQWAAEAREPMWLVEKGNTRLYLVGSMHVLPRSVSAARPALIRALNDSRAVYFEISSIEGANPKLEGYFRQYGIYSNPDKLDRHLSPDAKKLVRLVLPVFRLNWQDVQNYKPWLLGMRLQQSVLRSPGFAASKGVDEYYETLARKKGKRVGSLETVQDQLKYFSQMSDTEQSASLVSDIEGLVWLHQDLELMGKMWETGAVDLFEKAMASHQSSKNGKRLFRDRNRRWLPQIVRLVEGDENAMVMVGMGHMVGPDGIVNLLRAKGYSVRQM
jgi:uncharacterized protein YbaP (TraB family)